MKKYTAVRRYRRYSHDLVVLSLVHSHGSGHDLTILWPARACKEPGISFMQIEQFERE